MGNTAGLEIIGNVYAVLTEGENEMIYSLSGEVVAKEPNLAVIECAGVGYACRTTLSSSSKLALGAKAKLYTFLSVREDSVELFGFVTQQELSCFKLLISVSGVGPKAAIAILSDIAAERFALLVASGDSKAFTGVKGIGLKTAQRIVLELKDKITKESLSAGFEAPDFTPVAENSAAGEAVAALTVLGYSSSEIAPYVAKLDPAMSSGEMIKSVLKTLGSK